MTFSKRLTSFLNSKSIFFYFYCVIILFVYLADAIMSYVTPTYLESNLSSSLAVGLIYSISSLTGLVMDVLVGEVFRKQRYRSFLRLGITLGIAFPLSFILLPAQLITFVIGMMIWGIYFEFLSFSNSQVIIEKTEKSHYESAWSKIYFFRAFALTIGPILGSLLIGISFNHAFFAAIFFVGIAFLLFLFNPFTTKEKPALEDKTPQSSISIPHQLKLWATFGKRLWLLIIFYLVIIFVDATFWTIGAILSEEIQQNNGGIPGIMIVLYTLPMFFMGFFTKKAAQNLGKKRVAFISAFIGSIFLILSSVSSDFPLILVFTFLFSVCISLTWPEIRGTFADYQSRLYKTRKSLMGMESSIYSVGYIIGPILSGLLADIYGHQGVFLIMGIALGVISLLCLLFVPRKIYLPQKALNNLGE